MPRTFSFGRLMIGVTLLCVFFAVAAFYGKDFSAYLLCASLFVPTGIVCLILVGRATRRKTMIVICILGIAIGAFFGAALMPAQLLPRHRPTTILEELLSSYIYVAIFPALGALALGGAVLGDEYLNRRAGRVI